MCVADSPCCTVETNTALYPPIEVNFFKKSNGFGESRSHILRLEIYWEAKER